MEAAIQYDDCTADIFWYLGFGGEDDIFGSELLSETLFEGDVPQPHCRPPLDPFSALLCSV